GGDKQPCIAHGVVFSRAPVVDCYVIGSRKRHFGRKKYGLFCVFKGAAGLDGRVRALAAGSCSIQDASPVLFERGACGSSGGRTTPRDRRSRFDERRRSVPYRR